MDSRKKNIYRIFDGICHLGEGPVWNYSEQKLYWTDIFNRRIWVYDPAERKSETFWQGDLMVGGFAFTKNGGIIMCTDKGVFIIREGRDGSRPELLYDFPFKENEMFNDITVDPAGRIFAGTLDRDDLKGELLLLEKGKKPRIVLEEVKCSNGMTFSMDERYFFHTESLSRKISRYDYDARTGKITHAQVLFQGKEEHGIPDGITMDSRDYIWAAFWGSSSIKRIDPGGRIAEDIKLPVTQPSSVMFGGKDLRDLYITTACQGAKDLETGYDDKGNFLGGPVYMCRMNVRGRKEWLADF